MRYLWTLSLTLLLACSGASDSAETTPRTTQSAPADGANAVATFAGGCFWCIEAPFEKVPGVIEAVSGYAGGSEHAPSYKQVSSGSTGHTESVQVHFDSTIVSYRQLLDFFWRQYDPTDAGGSFYDRGSQYRSAVFYHNDAQRQMAEDSKAALAASGRFDDSIVTPIVPLDTFWVAEEYHQDYYKKNPRHYNQYRSGSGRDRFIDAAWGDDRVPDWLTELRDEHHEAEE